MPGGDSAAAGSGRGGRAGRKLGNVRAADIEVTRVENLLIRINHDDEALSLDLQLGLPVRKAISSTSWSLMVGSRENAAPPVPGPPSRSCTLILSLWAAGEAH